MMQSRRTAKAGRVRARVASVRKRSARSGRRRPMPPAAPAARSECVCSFGATRVGPMLERVRLHVTTDRFLAGRRGDKIWEAACDYAALALTRLAARLPGWVLEEWICAT